MKRNDKRFLKLNYVEVIETEPACDLQKFIAGLHDLIIRTNVRTLDNLYNFRFKDGSYGNFGSIVDATGLFKDKFIED